MDNVYGLEQCKRLIEASLGWGDPGSWTNQDFDNLSDRIFDSTSVRLSVSTLKRIWGKVRYESSPTMATLNALAGFAGFPGWRDFVARQIPPTADTPSALPAHQPALTVPRLRRTVTPIIVITVTVAALLSFISARIVRTSSTGATLRFDHHRTSELLPNSVVFDYDATPLHPKSVMIQQSWDPNRRELVDPNGKQHTSIYYYPGFFRAKLVVDGEVKRQSEVHIPTRGWKGIIGNDPLPIYLAAAETTLDSGRLGISARTLQGKTGSPVFSNRGVGFFNIREFPGIGGDHFLLKTTVRNTSTVEQSLCRNVRITLMGKENPIIIPLSDKGCVSGLGIFTGSSMVSGKDHDLSAFGCDWSQWQQVICGQEKGILNIWLNGQLVYSIPGNRGIGDLVGISIVFEGAGEIKEVLLKGSGEPLDLLKQP